MCLTWIMQVGVLLRRTANQDAVVTFPALNVRAFAREQSSELSECFVSCRYAVVYISNNLLLLSFLLKAVEKTDWTYWVSFVCLFVFRRFYTD